MKWETYARILEKRLEDKLQHRLEEGQSRVGKDRNKKSDIHTLYCRLFKLVPDEVVKPRKKEIVCLLYSILET